MMSFIEEVLCSINEIDDTVMEYDLEVTNALIDSYNKALTIMENYSGNSISDFSIFQEGFVMEADENEEKKFTFRQTNQDGSKENIVKSILYAIPRLIKLLIDTIKRKMNKQSIEKLENNVDAIDDRHLEKRKYAILRLKKLLQRIQSVLIRKKNVNQNNKNLKMSIMFL